MIYCRAPCMGMYSPAYGIYFVVSWHDRTSDYRSVLSPGAYKQHCVYPTCVGGDHGSYQNLHSLPTFWIVSHDGDVVVVLMPVIDSQNVHVLLHVRLT